jgi:hypothetical protein
MYLADLKRPLSFLRMPGPFLVRQGKTSARPHFPIPLMQENEAPGFVGGRPERTDHGPQMPIQPSKFHPTCNTPASVVLKGSM